MQRLSEILACRSDTTRRAGRTTESKGRMSTCDVASEGCKVFDPPVQRRDSSRYMLLRTTRSTPDDIFATHQVTVTIDKERCTSGKKLRALPRKRPRIAIALVPKSDL